MSNDTSQADIERLRAIKGRLHAAAKELSVELGHAPVVVVVGGDQASNTPATVAGWSQPHRGREGRFRDVVGILQSAIQFESFAHYMEDDLFQELKEHINERSWWSGKDIDQSGNA